MSDSSRPTDWYTTVLGTVEGYRRGITSGSCAQAAAKAAALMLSSGEILEEVRITLPKSKSPFSERTITLPVENGWAGKEYAVAEVRKDAGDDADITHGLLFRCIARWKTQPGIALLGGEGVGAVTKPGLAVPPGEAAINPIPRQMILQETEKVAGNDFGIALSFEIPRGKEVAAETWNPRLGIEHGISIIGTTGVVEPKSSHAYRNSIAAFIKAATTQGQTTMVMASGYVGEGYLKRVLNIPSRYIVTVGDHFGFSLNQCVKRKCRAVYLVGHIGKLAKLAAGIFDTHSAYGDARLETLAALAGAEGASQDLIEELLTLRLAESAVTLLQHHHLDSVFTRLAERIVKRVREYTGGVIEIGVVVLDLEGTPLAALPQEIIGDETWKNYLS